MLHVIIYHCQLFITGPCCSLSATAKALYLNVSGCVPALVSLSLQLQPLAWSLATVDRETRWGPRWIPRLQHTPGLNACLGWAWMVLEYLDTSWYYDVQLPVFFTILIWHDLTLDSGRRLVLAGWSQARASGCFFLTEFVSQTERAQNVLQCEWPSLCKPWSEMKMQLERHMLRCQNSRHLSSESQCTKSSAT